ALSAGEAWPQRGRRPADELYWSTTSRNGGARVSLDFSKNIGAYEAKTHFSELLERVAQGDEVTITRHGSPVAKLVPGKRKATPDERRAAMEKWKESRKGLSLGGLKIKDLIREGRR